MYDGNSDVKLNEKDAKGDLYLSTSLLFRCGIRRNQSYVMPSKLVDRLDDGTLTVSTFPLEREEVSKMSRELSHL